MGRDRAGPALEGSAPRTRDALALVEEFHHLGAQAHVELLLAQGRGHRGGVAFDFHVISKSDSGELPLGIGRGLGGQGPEGRAGARRPPLLA